MARLTTKMLSGLLVMGLFAAFASQAQAVNVTGTNPFLPSSRDFYIPLRSATSGSLGDPLPDGNQVGLDSDSAALSGEGATSSGSVDIKLDFALSIDPRYPTFFSGAFLFEFSDLDFVPVTEPGSFTYSEWLEIRFLRDSDDTPPVDADLVINDTNYHIFEGGPPGTQTDNTNLVYTIEPRDQLGLDNADFDDMYEDQEFSLILSFHSQLTRLGAGEDTYLSTVTGMPENMFTAVFVPEPATLSLLALGGLALIRRRK